MRWFDVTRLRLRALFARGRADADLDRELRAHLEQQVEELTARGLSPEEARRTAVSTFGGVERVREESRDARGVSFMENIGRDLRYALRGLRREPMLLVAATISIAVGAGGNLAVFSLAREFMFTPPDVRRPDQLVQFRVSHGSHASYQRWLDLRASDVLGDIAGFSIEKELNWRNGDEVTSVMPMHVTSNFFDVTGVPVAFGRPFSDAETRAESDPRVVLVTHSFWRSKLGSDSAVLGRTLTLNNQSYVILGVLAPRLRSVAGFAISPSVYVPLSRSLVPDLDDADANVVRLVGRLKPGQTLEQGRLAVDAADRRLGRLAGDTVYAGVQEFGSMSTIISANGPKAFRIVGGFFFFLGLVSFMVLLIACANVAGLLIARGTRRRQEIAIRLAIGGTRVRLLQQFLAEGFWLALVGTAGGLGLSVVFMRIVNSLSLPIPIPVELNLVADPAMLLAAVVVIFLSIVLCAVLPAIGATRLSLVPALKREEPFYATRRFTARSVLLIGQVTVSTVLLVTAFLFLRNLQRTQVTDPGFEVNRALVAQVGFVRGLPEAERAAYLQRAVEQVGALPGVEEAASTGSIPLTVSGASSSGREVRIDGADVQHVQYSRNYVGPGYFSTLNVRVSGGRQFNASDAPGAPLVAIINEEFVRKYYNGRNAVGSQMRFEGGNVVYDIVGVVANGKHEMLGEQQRAALYLPLRQAPEELAIAFVVARTRGDPAVVVPAIRQALNALDRSVAVQVEPMRSALRFSLLPSQIGAAILGTLGFLGLVLAAFGLYALVSYNVSRRVSEIAIRTALGATRGGILRLVVRDAAVLVGGGVVFGLAVAAFVTAPLATFLADGLSSKDPLSFGATLVAFVVVAVLASWLPARQATKVSPVVAMRLD
jgi:predicted permease